MSEWEMKCSVARKKKLNGREAEIEKIRLRLLEEKKKILLHFNRGGISEENPPKNGADDLDLSSSDQIFHFKIQQIERYREKLQLIERALEKIRLKSYGVCDVCERVIEIKRLLVHPLSPLCIECAWDMQQ